MRRPSAELIALLDELPELFVLATTDATNERLRGISQRVRAIRASLDAARPEGGEAPVAWTMSYAHPGDASICGRGVYFDRRELDNDKADVESAGAITTIRPLIYGDASPADDAGVRVPREPTEAIKHVAVIAHCGGLVNMDDRKALATVRLLTRGVFAREFAHLTTERMRSSAATALAASTQEGG